MLLLDFLSFCTIKLGSTTGPKDTLEHMWEIPLFSGVHASKISSMQYFFLVALFIICLLFSWPAFADKFSLFFAAVMPDFAQVYGFIGSVFDPNSTGHLQRLKQMDQINLETVCPI